MRDKFQVLFLILIAITIFFPGCEIIGGIFKAGVWTGLIAVIIVIALIIWAIRAMMK